MLVTLHAESDQIRSDTSVDDNDLELKISAASKAVINYLKGGADAFLDSSGEIPLNSFGDPEGVPEEVQEATLMLIDSFYNYRGGWEVLNGNYLPQAVVALLYPLRKPAVA